MAKKAYEESNISAIGSAIKTLVGGDSGYKVSQMADAISTELQKKVTGTKSITTNGTYDVSEFASANVNVSGGGSATIVSKSITANGTYNASSDSADGYNPVTVNVPQPSGSQTYTQNGTYDVSAIAEAIINVSGGSSLPANIWVGEETITADTYSGNPHHVSCDFNGVVPNLIVFCVEDVTALTKNATVSSFTILGVNTQQCINYNYQSHELAYANYSRINNVSSTGFDIGGASSTYPLTPGKVKWVAMYISLPSVS